MTDTDAPSRPASPPPPPPALGLAQEAARLLSRYTGTREDAAAEVEAGSGERRARTWLPEYRDDAARALAMLATALPLDAAREVMEIRDAVKGGYARDCWTLRILRFAALPAPREPLPTLDDPNVRETVEMKSELPRCPVYVGSYPCARRAGHTGYHEEAFENAHHSATPRERA